MAFSTFNGIVILDAIPEGELNTARRLCEQLEDISTYSEKQFALYRYRINSFEDLRNAIGRIRVEVRNSGLKPWLHFDGHGSSDEDGIAVADGSSCSWSQLKELITPLNVDLRLNLLLILASCFGGSFARSFRITDRAPMLGLIGPTREITAGDSDKSFRAFYQTFFESNSIRNAINALTEGTSNGLYYITTAEQFFYDVWRGYKVGLCSEEMIDERARKMYRHLKRKSLPRAPSVGQLKRQIVSEESQQFELFRDTYFMCDLEPSHRKRFQVTHAEAERRINAYEKNKAKRRA